MKKLHYPIHRHEQKRLLGFIDGLEGGFAIFAGIVVGLSFATTNRSVLILTAMIGIMVNAVNAATIRYSTEHYVDELDGHEKQSRTRNYLFPAIIEFLLYILVSFLAVLPLLLVTSLPVAITIMITVCLVILFSAGAIRGATLGNHPVKDGIELTVGGIIMIAFGALAGWLLTRLFVN
jgi:VIT1/CCC1 family predicted Fe2+/Mn2+ transporter